jgi:hypothetical protein
MEIESGLQEVDLDFMKPEIAKPWLMVNQKQMLKAKIPTTHNSSSVMRQFDTESVLARYVNRV